MDELIYNKKQLGKTTFDLDNIFENDNYEQMKKHNKSNLSFCFRFNEFEKLKYEFVKIGGRTSSDAVSYYKMFEKLRDIPLNELEEVDYNFIRLKYYGLKNTIDDYNKKLKNEYKDVQKYL
jgi:hypothetical protein